MLRIEIICVELKSLLVYHVCQVEPMLSPQEAPQVYHSHLNAYKCNIFLKSISLQID